MSFEHHELGQEFPEYKEAIHALKLSNAHFKRLFNEYHEVDRQVYRIEAQVETVTDEYLETLKKQRLNLKDELYELIKATARA